MMMMAISLSSEEAVSAAGNTEGGAGVLAGHVAYRAERSKQTATSVTSCSRVCRYFGGFMAGPGPMGVKWREEGARDINLVRGLPVRA